MDKNNVTLRGLRYGFDFRMISIFCAASIFGVGAGLADFFGFGGGIEMMQGSS